MLLSRGEMAVIVIATAVVGLVVLLVLGSPGPGRPTPPSGPFLPPVTTRLTWPATSDECKDGRWRRFGQFRDEAACVALLTIERRSLVTRRSALRRLRRLSGRRDGDGTRWMRVGPPAERVLLIPAE